MAVGEAGPTLLRTQGSHGVILELEGYSEERDKWSWIILWRSVTGKRCWVIRWPCVRIECYGVRGINDRRPVTGDKTCEGAVNLSGGG